MLRRPRAAVEDALARVTGPAVRHLLRPLSVRGRLRPGPLEGGRRLLLLQLDGVGRRRLEWALGAGHMPWLARRLERRLLDLSPARSGAPASTPAFQAGLLYGVAPSVPGFVWYDRARGREVRMDRAADAAEVEASLARRHPPLLRGGTSYFSIFSGGAALPHFCLSGLAGDYPLDALTEGFSGWDALASAVVHAVTVTRMAGRAGHELWVGAWDALAQAWSLGRLKHEPRFLLHRLLVGAFMRELAVQGLVIDVARGVPVIFCDLIGFDEFAHRRGPDAPAALDQLRSIDLALAAIFAAVDAVPELGYDVFVFADHGHVATRPFQGFTGLSLPDYLALAEGGVPLPRDLGDVEAVRLAQFRAVRELIARWPPPLRGPAGRGLDRLERGIVGHALGFGQTDRVITAEAGDLAHVYLAPARAPLGLAELTARHPALLAALAASPAVGMVAVRDEARGSLLVEGRRLRLDQRQDVARLPHPDPSLLATYVADLLTLPASGDLVVLGWRGAGRPSVAYAWEFGSHGGVAPDELEIFFLHAPGRGLGFEAALRPDGYYRLFQDAYRRPARAPRAPRPPRPLRQPRRPAAPRPDAPPGDAGAEAP